MDTTVRYNHIAEIQDVVRRFETCAYRKDEFVHARHLAVAAWYLWTSAPGEALDRMRAMLLQFTAHHGVTGYHETITRFWLQAVQEQLGSPVTESAFVARVNDLIQRLGSKDLLFRYYSRELVMSDEARRAWIEPDLQDLAASAAE
jgi:hypothetical protein